MLQYAKLYVTVIYVSLCLRKYWTRNSPYVVLFLFLQCRSQIYSNRAYSVSILILFIPSEIQLKIFGQLGECLVQLVQWKSDLKMKCHTQFYMQRYFAHGTVHVQTWTSKYKDLIPCELLWLQSHPAWSRFKALEAACFSVALWHPGYWSAKTQAWSGSCLGIPGINFILAPCVTDGCHLSRTQVLSPIYRRGTETS